jgi:hypothetical protein
MRSRALLHKSKLSEFNEWVISRGWKLYPPKGDYEVLVAKRKKPDGTTECAKVYDRNRGDHFTVFGPSLRLALEFLSTNGSRSDWEDSEREMLGEVRHWKD